MAPDGTLQCEVEKLPPDQDGKKLTTIKCRGRLVAQNSGQIRELVKPLISDGGRIVIDLRDLTYLDSAGLGTLIGLKVTAIHQGFCILELANLTPRIKELLRITNLVSVFSGTAGF